MARAKKQKAAKRGAKPAVAKGGSPVVKTSEDKSSVEVSPKVRSKFKITPKQERPEFKRMVGAPRLLVRSCRLLLEHKKLFGTILVVYAAVYIVLVGGLSSSNLNAAKASLLSVHAGGNLAISSTLFSTLLSSSNSGDTAAGAYQTILLFIISLVLIWSFRQLYAGQSIRARDAYYKAVYPLVPFLLVFLVVAVQLLPLVLGGGMYSLVVGGGIVNGILPSVLVGALALAMASVSFYWICSSIIALYVVTLPDMTPMKALRSARQLVHFRRWVVLRKLLFLPFILLVVGLVILMPIARYATSFAVFIFFILTVAAIAVIHSYMYALYRELL